MSGAGRVAGRRAEMVALGVIALAVVALTLEGFAGGLPSVRDMASGTIPSRWFWRESVLAGHLPIWNPDVSLGFPTIASPVHGSLYPFHFLLALLPFRAGFFATWALHACIAGAGGYALARSCECRSESALVSGLVWAVGGYVTSMWWNGEKLLVTAWIPWIAWGVREVALAPRIFGKELALAAAFGAMLCAAGDPFLLFDAALLAVFVAFVALPERAAASPMRVVAASGAVFGLTLVLAIPVLLPAALLSPDTTRSSALALRSAQAWSMHPVRWLELFVPSPLGNPLGDATSYAGAPYADVPAQVHPWAVSLFVGSATLALATAARGRRVVLPLWGAAFVAVLFALGRHAPFDEWARSILPGLARSRFPEKHAVVACGAVALLASRGVEEVLEGGERDKRGRSVLRVLAIACAGLALAVILAPAPLQATTRRGAIHAALAIAFLGSALYATRRDARLAWLVSLVVAVDLVASSRPLLDWMPASALEAPPLARALATHPGEAPRRILRLPSADFRRVATLPENAPSLFGVGAVPGWDPAVSPLVDPIANALAGNGPRLAELLRIDAVMVPSDPDVMTPEWTVLREPPRPRAWMVGRAVQATDDAEALRDLAAPELDPEASAIVAAGEIHPDVAALGSGAPRAMGACDVVDYRDTRVALRCRADGPALLVVADTAMRGWRAWVDGAPTAIVRANVAMRGVALAPGAHDVEMRFEPPGFVEALLIGALGWLTAALAIARSTRRTAANPRPSARRPR